MNVRTIVVGVIAATTCASALAQSGVTIYGVIDLFAGRLTGARTGVNARDAATYQVGSGGMTTSNFGFRGTEDLGDGMYAAFDLSAFIRVDTGELGRSGAIGPPVNVAADPTFSRFAWVGLGDRTWGRVRLGTSPSLLWVNCLTTSAFLDSSTFSPISLLTAVGGPLSGGTGWADQVMYDSPSFSGFSFNGAYAVGEGHGGGNAGFRLSYGKGPFAASLVAETIKKNPLTFADGTSPDNTTAWQLAASYNFDVVWIFTHVGRIKDKGTETAPLSVRYRVWDLSASVPMGPFTSLLLGYGARSTGDRVGPVPPAVAGGNRDRKIFSGGIVYLLSKRSDLYAMATSDKTATITLPGPGTSVGARATDYAVGFRHRF